MCGQVDDLTKLEDDAFFDAIGSEFD